MKLGVNFPQNIIGGDAAIVRHFAHTVEDLGYSHIIAYDHVVGVNRAAYPDWRGPYDSSDLFHDPFTLFSFIAGFTERIELSPQIMILPQRQTVLAAKQAASLDALSGGRLRLGVGIGWNEVEYVALGENFRNRGRRAEEQIAVMRALWSEPHVIFDGEFHQIPNAGINPMPAQRPLPVWMGASAKPALERIGRIGDGWLCTRSDPQQVKMGLDSIRYGAEQAGRDPQRIGLDCWVGLGNGTPDDWRAEIEALRVLGATHITLNTISSQGGSSLTQDPDVDTHLRAIERYIAATGDLF